MRKNKKRDDKGWCRGNEHVTNVREKRRACRRGSQYGSVGQGGDFVAEIGSRNDRAGDPRCGNALALPNADQGNTDGGNGGPGTSRDERYHGANDTASEKEYLGAEYFKSVVNHG